METEKLLSDADARKVLLRIDQMYPDAKGELNWDSTFHLLCAVLMSAQTTDKMVNRVTPKFFAAFPQPTDLANADLKVIESYIAKIGLFHSKAKHLKETAKILVDQYHSQIPADKEILITLPGVGEKTANVVLAEGFKIPAIAVDTHVARISKKFKIVPQNATPHQIEKRLEALLPREKWIHTHHAMILFGRYTMPARAKDPNPYHFLK
jgi:endonuclease-3